MDPQACIDAAREPEATALTEYARSIGDIVIEYDRGFVWGGYAT